MVRKKTRRVHKYGSGDQTFVPDVGQDEWVLKHSGRIEDAVQVAKEILSRGAVVRYDMEPSCYVLGVPPAYLFTHSL